MLYVYLDLSMASGLGDDVSSVRVISVDDVLAILCFALFGLIEPENLPPLGYSPYFAVYIVKIVFFLFHLVTLIVLINLLIATMSDTYQRIQVFNHRKNQFPISLVIMRVCNFSIFNYVVTSLT